MRLTKFDNWQPATPLTRIVAAVLVLPYLIIGIKEIISPIGVDATFGIPLEHSEGLKYLSVVGARNIVLSLLILFFSFTGNRASMVAMYAAIALMAAMDCYLVSSAVGITNEAIKHAVFVVLMSVMSIWIANAGIWKR